MGTVLNNALVTFKDSRWLTLEVCREYQRNKCTRTDTECKYAHPLPHVEVQNGRVTACFDSIKGRCNREKPPCKYLHPPQHLKEQLLVNGRNNLALKNAALMGQIAAFSPFLPATLTPGAVGATTLGACPLTCSVTAPTSPPPPPYLPPSGQPGAPTLISLGTGEANHHGGPATPLGYALNFHHHPTTATHPRASQFLTALAPPPPGQPGAAPTAYQLILNHHPAAAAYQAAGVAAKAAGLTRSPYLNGCQPIENGAPTGHTLFLHNGTALTLAATGLINPSGGPSLLNGAIPASYCINAPNGKASSLNAFQHRQDRMEVCREYQRGNCKRSMTECKYAHPPDHVLVDGHTSTVTVCIDALKGRCTRGEQQCRYFHPPAHPSQQLQAQQQHQQHITYHQQQQQMASSSQHVQYHHVTDASNEAGTVVVAMSTAPFNNPEMIMTTNGLPPGGPVVVLTPTPQRLSVDATAFRPTDPDPPSTGESDTPPLIPAPSGVDLVAPVRVVEEVNGADSDGTNAPTYMGDPNHGSLICNGVNESGEDPKQSSTLGSESRFLEASEDAKNTFITAAAHVSHPPPPSPTTHHHRPPNLASIATTTTLASHKTPNATAASDGPRARKRARPDPAALYYTPNDLAGPAYVVCSVAAGGPPTVSRTALGPTPLYSLYLPPHALQFHHGLGLDGLSPQQPQPQQLYLQHSANAASNYLAAAPMSAVLSLQSAPQTDPKRVAGPAAMYDSNGAPLYNGHHHQQHQAPAQHYYAAATGTSPAAQAQIIYAPPGATTHHLIQHGHPHPGTFQPPHHFIPVAFASPATANGLPPY